MMKYSILFNPVILVMKLLLGEGTRPFCCPVPFLYVF